MISEKKYSKILLKFITTCCIFQLRRLSYRFSTFDLIFCFFFFSFFTYTTINCSTHSRLNIRSVSLVYRNEENPESCFIILPPYRALQDVFFFCRVFSNRESSLIAQLHTLFSLTVYTYTYIYTMTWREENSRYGSNSRLSSSLTSINRRISRLSQNQ